MSSRQSRDIRRRSRAIIWTIRRIRREAWLHFRLDIGLHLFELAADFWLHEMRELARAGLREMDPIAGTQPYGLAVNVGAGSAVLPGLVGKGLPYVDVGGACLFGVGAIKLVEGHRVGGEPLAFQDWKPDPDEWNFLIAEHTGDRFDPLRVGRLPFRRSWLVAAIGVVQGLPVVAADQHDRVVDFLAAREQVLRGFGPIEEIVADETRIFLRLAKDRDLRPVLERLAQSLRQHLAEAVAKDRDEKAWRDVGLSGLLCDGFFACSLRRQASRSFGRRIA